MNDSLGTSENDMLTGSEWENLVEMKLQNMEKLRIGFSFIFVLLQWV